MAISGIRSRFCFVCGVENDSGLKVEFSFDGHTVKAQFEPGRQHCGFDGIVHGGILFTLVDEAMMQLVHANGFRAVTAEVSIKFIKPAAIGNRLFIGAEKLDDRHHLISCRSFITDSSGTPLCRAEGKFLKYRSGGIFTKSWL